MIEILNNDKVVTITEGDPCKLVFTCKSKGYTGPLSLQSSCGCSIPDGPRYVEDGQVFNVTVTFDSTGRKGNNVKSVALTTNENTYKAKFTIKVL
jgi:hypothetical protein